MKPKLLLRIASLLTLFIAIVHIMEYISRKVTTDPTGIAVIRQMETYKFNFNGSVRSLDNFYEGLSLNLSLVLIIFAVIFAMLSVIAKKHHKVCYNMLWPYLICNIGFAITGFRYFFIVPGITFAAICLVIIYAMFQLHQHSKSAENHHTYSE